MLLSIPAYGFIMIVWVSRSLVNANPLLYIRTLKLSWPFLWFSDNLFTLCTFSSPCILKLRYLGERIIFLNSLFISLLRRAIYLSFLWCMQDCYMDWLFRNCLLLPIPFLCWQWDFGSFAQLEFQTWPWSRVWIMKRYISCQRSCIYLMESERFPVDHCFVVLRWCCIW